MAVLVSNRSYSQIVCSESGQRIFTTCDRRNAPKSGELVVLKLIDTSEGFHGMPGYIGGLWEIVEQ